ncbi:Molybdopterin biosynthesis protein MoeA [hydrothermal vent metagenome]|uniref:Molybdopterin biosynthesis protein MoeA n=1 Tax=hydrothermal vent metagenome TaxID=652676 RepID=A0A1W1E6I1_9ZZZZ
MDLKNSKINKICHFANHPYLSAREATHCKGLNLTQETKDMHKAIGLIGIISACQNEA